MFKNHTFDGLEDYIEVSPNFTQEFTELKARGIATAMQVVKFFNLQPSNLPPGHFLYFECCSGGAIYLCWKSKTKRFFDRDERLFMVRPTSLLHFELNEFSLSDSDRVYYEPARVIEYPTESIQVTGTKEIPGIFADYPKQDEAGNPVYIRYAMKVDSTILRMVSAKGLKCSKYLTLGHWVAVIITESGFGVYDQAKAYLTEKECQQAVQEFNKHNEFEQNYCRLLIYYSMKNSINIH